MRAGAVEIEFHTSCGSSPASRLLRDLVVAMARADAAGIAAAVADDVRWQPVGRKPVEGVDAFTKAVTRYGAATRLVLEHVVSEGGAGAVQGVVELGAKRRAFCHVVELRRSPKAVVSAMTSFSVPLP